MNNSERDGKPGNDSQGLPYEKEMTNRKKLLAALLLLAVLGSILSPAATTPARAANTMTLAELQAALPHGTYWNHRLSEESSVDYTEYSKNRDYYNLRSTTVPCGHKNGVSCGCGPDYDGSCGCNSHSKSTQCNGFARFICYKLFGSTPSGNGKTESDTWKATTIEKLRPGDYIRYEEYKGHYGHSVVVIGVDAENGAIQVGECNHSGCCKIEWGRTITFDALNSFYGVHCLTAGGTSAEIGITSPRNDSWIDPNKELSVIWCNVPGARSYQYKVKCESGADAGTVVAEGSTTSTSFSIPAGSLSCDERYKIWVADCVNGVPRSAGSIIYININGRSDYCPTITSPVSGCRTVDPADVNIEWQAVEGASAYLVSIKDLSSNICFEDYDRKNVGTATLVYITPEEGPFLKELTEYRIAVCAVMPAGEFWSEAEIRTVSLTGDEETDSVLCWQDYDDGENVAVSINSLSEFIDPPLIVYYSTTLTGTPAVTVSGGAVTARIAAAPVIDVTGGAGSTDGGYFPYLEVTPIGSGSAKVTLSVGDSQISLNFEVTDLGNSIIDIDCYTVTFNATGGECETSAVVIAGASYPLPAPKKPGYIFAGWYTAAEGGSRIGKSDDLYRPTADITLYAHWKKAGDMDGNGEVNGKDVSVLFKWWSGKTVLGNETVLTGDYNGDGVTDIRDAAAMYQAWSKSV